MLITSAMFFDYSAAGSDGAGGGGGEGAGGAGEGGAPDTDLRAVVESTQRELAERTGKYENEIAELRQGREKTDGFLNRLREALTPEEQRAQEKDPTAAEISEYERQLDTYLQAAVEAERAGRPIPLTVNLAVQHFQAQIKSAKENQRLGKELKDLRAKADRASDPNAQIDSAAYATMDSHVINALETVYGPEGQNDQLKQVQFEAITKLLASEVRDLKKNESGTWDRIRRNPKAIQKMVNHFVEQSMPPKARQIIEQERLAKTPLTVKELQDAFGQAAAIQDPKERATTRAAIRQAILEQTFGRGRGYNAVG